ncbi:AI-2E family transporter [Novosphingopyxis sp. YJ-S2-01]|uniref:AI-2E family transporter n=1 Tax=Novosphingopyxis sp. YJ-S2-01 TaxID=2794021 RepID=UPI0018DCEF27|nr:AI-2E family transporter [Novosphingopyxis sp. YJ-S2-01]
MNEPEEADDHIESVGPTELYDPVLRTEFKRALVWLGTALAIGVAAYLAQPILLIIGGIVVGSMLDGGTRLLGRVMPAPRGIRLAIVVLAATAFILWTVFRMGSELSAQASSLQEVMLVQMEAAGDYARSLGFAFKPQDLMGFADQAFSSLGPVTAAVTSFVGAVAGLSMMLVLAIFFAAEPRLYEHGLAWMLPMAEREHFYGTMEKIGWTLRRLMAGRLIGMAVEGIGTWVLLWAGGVPMAALLGILTGLLAFLPNIGAIISGALIILVGFSTSTETGLYALVVYLIVQGIDGYVIVPMVAKRAVDLAPALVLGAQILFGTLFGLLGLALADPIVAMLKVFLERRSSRAKQRAAERRAAIRKRKQREAVKAELAADSTGSLPAT